MQRFRSCHRDVSLPGMHSLRKIERDRFFSKIAQSTLRYEGTVGDLWSYLDGFDKRVVAESNRHSVVDARSPADFFEVRAGGNRERQHARMRADAHDQFVAPLPDRLADVKNGGREARQVLADLHAIQPNHRSELRALLMRSIATCRRAVTANVRRYQNQLRSCRETPALYTMALRGTLPSRARFRINCRLTNSSTWANAGWAECASPGTGALWLHAVGTASASFESSISQAPSSEIVVRSPARRGVGKAAATEANTTRYWNKPAIFTRSLAYLRWSVVRPAKPQIDRFLHAIGGERHWYFPSFAGRSVSGI